MATLIDSRNNRYTMAQVKAFGERFHTIMTDSAAPGCSVPRITFSLNDLYSPSWSSEYRPKCLQEEHKSMIEAAGLGLPIESQIHNFDSQYRYIWINNLSTWTEWCGYVGPGVIFIDVIMRAPATGDPVGDPRLTDMTKAVYETSFPMDSLKHIFICDIVNQETCRIVNDHIIRRTRRLQANTSYEIDSDLFKVILGTELGRFVARFILGTWGQGVKRVERITVMAYVPTQSLTNLRFDIGDCPS